jgi:hypothetical protein
VSAPHTPGDAARRATAACLTALGLIAAPHPLAWSQSASSSGLPATSANLYRLVKRFDFDERPLGNYEDVPMHWVPLRGHGLPHFNVGALDEAQGADAAPSFRLRVRAFGNVAYEYERNDLAAIPGSDYLLTARVRAEGLKHARAFLAAYFVDRFSTALPGTLRVSNCVASTGLPHEPWQELRLQLPGDYAEAYAVHIQLWVMQSHVWREPDPSLPDPIPQHDVVGSACFDDLAVFRLPRTRLTFSNPARFVAPGSRAALHIECHNATPYPLAADLRLFDEAGSVLATERMELAPDGERKTGTQALSGTSPGERENGAVPLAVPLPHLPPGAYSASFRLLLEDEPLLERRLGFVVLGELPGAALGVPDLGLDLGCWGDANPEPVWPLLREMGCAAVKVGVRMNGGTLDDADRRSLDALTSCLTDLHAQGVDTVGVLLPPDAGPQSKPIPSARAWLTQDSRWAQQASPVLERLSGLLATWQIGDERADGRVPHWSDAERTALRDFLRRFITVPRLIVAGSCTDRRFSPQDVSSLLVPDAIPARAFPEQLAGMPAEPESWLALELAYPEARGTDDWADLARRVILARATGATRCYLPAPAGMMRHGEEGPGRAYLVLRTLFHALSGRRAAIRTEPAPEVEAWFFEGGGSACLALWTWSASPAEPFGMYLGPRARAVDLLGRPVEVPLVAGRALLQPRAAPIFLFDVDARLARLAESFWIEPTLVDSARTDQAPIVRFRNHYDEPVRGELTFTVPVGWQISPAVLPIEVGRGQAFEHPVHVDVPPREVVGAHHVEAHLDLTAPVPQRLDFVLPLSVGLAGIELSASATWEEDTLVVEYRLANQSERPVSFRVACQAPNRQAAEGAFIDVPPGEEHTHLFIYPEGRDLAEQRVELAVQEIGGLRRVEQLVPVPLPARP